jgi:hypothetical protein
MGFKANEEKDKLFIAMQLADNQVTETGDGPNDKSLKEHEAKRVIELILKAVEYLHDETSYMEVSKSSISV